MKTENYILNFSFIILNFGLGVINVERGSYYYAALSFTTVGFIVGLTAAVIINGYTTKTIY